MNVEVEFSLEKRVESEGNCLGDKEVKGIDEIVRYHKSEATLHKYFAKYIFLAWLESLVARSFRSAARSIQQ